MDPQNSGPYCILCRDLKVLLRQRFNSLLQVFVAACSSLSRLAPCASFLDSVATEFPLSLQIFLWLLTICLQGLSFYPFYVATILCVITGILMLRH